MDDLTQRVYRAFDPSPLTEAQQDLYVHLEDVRGQADVVSRLSRKIRFAEGRPTCQVLAGHRGSGKSTELCRLKNELESKEPRYFVVYCKADENVDRNDVDFPDILTAIVRQMASQLKERADVKLKPGYFKDRWDRLKRLLLSEVEFEGLELGDGMATISTAIKSSPDTRIEIRKLFEQDAGNWLNAANDAIGEALLQLSTKQYDGLVILVDDLDKMTVRPHETGGSTDEYLFVRRAAQLTSFKCHVVYTMPLSLAYSHNEQAVKNSFGGHVPVVPMIKIANQPQRSKPYAPGVKKMREVIDRRLAHAGVTKPSDVFASDAVRDELIALSGGQPTELMTLVREGIIAHSLPIDRTSLNRAKIEGQREYARMLRAEHWPILKTVRATGICRRSIKTEQAFRELIESRAILQYVNDTEWYALNPMVAALKPPPDKREPGKS